MKPTDRKLGMHRDITRRDFIHDVSLAALAVSLPASIATALAEGHGVNDRYYPPIKTGLRGAHPGSFEVAHALAREGKTFGDAPPSDEDYDLIVVGGGISGLSAAYFYRKLHGQDARVLILDNHDDFGGHAKRNEFHHDGTMRLAWGGTVNMEYTKYSSTAMGLLNELGIEIPRLLEESQFAWMHTRLGMQPATWFGEDLYAKETLIRNVNVADLPPEELAAIADQLPISETDRQSLVDFLLADKDVLAGMNESQKREYLHTTRYEDFLKTYFGLSGEAIEIFSGRAIGYWGVRAADLSVAECIDSGLPAAHVVGIAGDNEAEEESESRASAMFPDGNASIARLLVRSLIPASTPQMKADADVLDIVSTELDYSQLDRSDHPVKLRLNSTAVHAENDSVGAGTTVTYVKNGKIQAAHGKNTVLACYNRIIPYLCPELPDKQKVALAMSIKRPMLIMNVLLRNGEALKKTSTSGAYLPGRLCQSLNLVTGLSAGDYRPEWKPEDPCILQFYGGIVPLEPEGLTISQQDQVGRARLLAMEFADFEREVRLVTNAIWKSGGFNAADDILAITVNRWPHGYSRDHLDLEDADWNASPLPNEVGRQRFGHISIANSDAGADAYTHVAIDQAWRAVNELTEA